VNVKTKKKYVLIAVFAIILMVVLTMLLNPLFLRTENQIRNNLLTLMPIGTSINEVSAVIEETNNWRVMHSSTERGYINTRYSQGNQVIGEQYISVALGRSSFLWDIKSSWVFDGDGILMDIYVVRLLAV